MSIVSIKYWKRYVLGPDHVDRPNPGQIKGYFIIKREFNLEFDYIWVRIGWATQSGHLGYYSGYSNDSEVIAVHLADPLDPDKLGAVRRNLKIAGAIHIKFHKMLVDDEDEQEVTLDDFSEVCFRRQVVNKEVTKL